MTVTATPIFPQAIKNQATQITNGIGTGATTVITPGTNGSKVESWIVTSTDTSNRDMFLDLLISGVNYQIGIINIAAGSGNTNSVPSINMLNQANLPGLARDANGNPYMYLANGSVLQAIMGTAVTSGKVITNFIQYGDF